MSTRSEIVKHYDSEGRLVRTESEGRVVVTTVNDDGDTISHLSPHSLDGPDEKLLALGSHSENRITSHKGNDDIPRENRIWKGGRKSGSETRLTTSRKTSEEGRLVTRKAGSESRMVVRGNSSERRTNNNQMVVHEPPVKNQPRHFVFEGSPEEDRPDAGLNSLNIANVLFYALNAVVSYGVGNAGWLGNGNNAELSLKYQVLVTPKTTAFAIWPVIFIVQLAFVLVQLLPRYRGSEIVQQGVSYYYILTCSFQVAWTVVFAYEFIWISMIFMALIWFSLLAMLYSQYYVKVDFRSNVIDFLLMRFPFAIHFGWITAATALNANVLVLDLNFIPELQLAVSILSLAALHSIAVWTTLALRKPNTTVAIVLAWACGWIYAELQSPQGSIKERFDGQVISAVSYSAAGVAIVVILQIVARITWSLMKMNELYGNNGNDYKQQKSVAASTAYEEDEDEMTYYQENHNTAGLLENGDVEQPQRRALGYEDAGEDDYEQQQQHEALEYRSNSKKNIQNKNLLENGRRSGSGRYSKDRALDNKEYNKQDYITDLVADTQELTVHEDTNEKELWDV